MNKTVLLTIAGALSGYYLSKLVESGAFQTSGTSSVHRPLEGMHYSDIQASSDTDFDIIEDVVYHDTD